MIPRSEGCTYQGDLGLEFLCEALHEITRVLMVSFTLRKGVSLMWEKPRVHECAVIRVIEPRRIIGVKTSRVWVDRPVDQFLPQVSCFNVSLVCACFQRIYLKTTLSAPMTAGLSHISNERRLPEQQHVHQAAVFHAKSRCFLL